MKGVCLQKLVSRRKLAELLGVSPEAVRKAIKNGRIFGSAIVGSKLDAEIAAKQFNKNRDVSKVRKNAKKAKKSEKPTIKKEEILKVTPSNVGIIPYSEIPGLEEPEEVSFKPRKSVSKGSSEEELESEYMFHRTRKEKEAADKLSIENAKRRGELVEVEKASHAFFNAIRGARNHWLDFSSKYAADLSAEWGLDKLTIQNGLDKFIAKHCEEMGEIKIEVTS
jgi:predicted acylesterase/phospholipase RssA